MSFRINITEDFDFSLPLSWMQLATVVYGARGSGKTTLGRVLAEEVNRAHQRFCAVDLKGDWWGLQSSADGKSGGIPVVIFGGDHADLPLEEAAGAFIAETVASIEQSCVVDLEHFSKGKQVRFLADFFEKLYEKNRNPLLCLLDEAQRYAPQLGGRGQDPQIARCLGAVEDLVKLGRKHGIGVVLFTQRGAGLNKEVSELCDMLAAFRTPGPLDQERISTWLEANSTEANLKKVMDVISSLDTGTAVFASAHPKLKAFEIAAVRWPWTYDSSATPEIGHKRKEPKKLAKADLSVLREQMKEAVERKRLEDPKELQRELRQLRVEIERATAERDVANSRTEELEKTLKLERDAARAKASGVSKERVQRLLETMQLLSSDFKEVKAAFEGLTSLSPVLVPARPMAPVTPLRVRPAVVPKPVSKSTNGASTKSLVVDSGNGGERRILIVLAQRPNGLVDGQIAMRAKLAVSGGSYSTYISRLRKAGYLEGDGPNSTRRITQAGLDALGSYDPLPTGRALFEYWRDELGGGAARMLSVLYEARDDVAQQDLADAANVAYSGGSFGTYLSRLRNLELVEGGYRGDAVRASAELYQ